MIIDVHHHWTPEKHFKNLETYIRKGEVVRRETERTYVLRGGMPVYTPTETYYNIESQLRDMDAAGVDLAILSLDTWQEWCSLEMSCFANEQLAEVVAKYPKRFVGLAHVPLDGGEGALRELDRAINELGLKGLAVTTHVRGKYLDSPEFWPFYEKVAALNAPVLIHPAPLPLHQEPYLEHDLTRTLGRTVDLTIAATRFLYSGVMERIPNLKIVVSHLGGAFFALKNKLDPFRRPPQLTPGLTSFGEGLKRLFVDTAPPAWGKGELMCALEVLGTDMVMLGSDYPFNIKSTNFMRRAVRIISNLEIAEDVKEKVFAGNAARVFNIDL